LSEPAAAFLSIREKLQFGAEDSNVNNHRREDFEAHIGKTTWKNKKEMSR
jgi:hypothetical protein